MPDYELLRERANELSTQARELVDIIGTLSRGVISGTEETLTDGQRTALLDRGETFCGSLKTLSDQVKAEIKA